MKNFQNGLKSLKTNLLEFENILRDMQQTSSSQKLGFLIIKIRFWRYMLGEWFIEDADQENDENKRKGA